jgi:hypothetical protein
MEAYNQVTDRAEDALLEGEPPEAVCRQLHEDGIDDTTAKAAVKEALGRARVRRGGLRRSGLVILLAGGGLLAALVLAAVHLVLHPPEGKHPSEGKFLVLVGELLLFGGVLAFVFLAHGTYQILWGEGWSQKAKPDTRPGRPEARAGKLLSPLSAALGPLVVTVVVTFLTWVSYEEAQEIAEGKQPRVLGSKASTQLVSMLMHWVEAQIGPGGVLVLGGVLAVGCLMWLVYAVANAKRRIIGRR